MEELRLEPYEVTVDPKALNCRVKPEISASIKTVIQDDGPYTISEEVLDENCTSWGKIEELGGWVQLSFTTRKPIE